jgi:hypothetical protein
MCAAVASPPKPPDYWGGRRTRTVRVSLDPAGRPYGRADFVNRVADCVGIKNLEAVGPTQDASVWWLTFTDVSHACQFVARGDFDVKGRKATVCTEGDAVYKVRVHWAPYYVSNQPFIAAIEATGGARVVREEWDRSVVKGMEHVRTGIRTLTVRTMKPSEIPHVVNYKVDGEERQALLTMTGRPPRCLRCGLNGHVRQQCSTPFCYKCRSFGHKKQLCPPRSYAAAAAGRQAPTMPEEEEEEEVDDEPSETTRDGQEEETDTDNRRNTRGADGVVVNGTVGGQPGPVVLPAALTDLTSTVNAAAGVAGVQSEHDANDASNDIHDDAMLSDSDIENADVDDEQTDEEHTTSKQRTSCSNQQFTELDTDSAPISPSPTTTLEQATSALYADVTAMVIDASKGLRRTASAASLGSMSDVDGVTPSVSEPTTADQVAAARTRQKKEQRTPHLHPSAANADTRPKDVRLSTNTQLTANDFRRSPSTRSGIPINSSHGKGRRSSSRK